MKEDKTSKKDRTDLKSTAENVQAKR